MESKNYTAGFVIVVTTSLFIAWLFPYTFSAMDPMWIFCPWFLFGLASVAYFSAMIYNRSFGIQWPGGKSTLAHGGVEVNFPARDYYPEMGACPLGGGNYSGVLFRGGKKKGWLIAPRSLLHVVDKQVTSFAGPIEQRTIDQLPPHIRNELMLHDLFDPDGMIVWALTRMDDVEFDPTSGMSASNLLQENLLLNESLVKLGESFKVQLDLNASMRREMKEFGIKFQESEKETFTEKIKESVGGE